MSIVLNSSGGGSVTINEPTTASNFTQTLPAATGDVMVSGNMPAFSASKQSATQAISATTWTKITFDTEEFDTANCFASSRFTPTVAGYYQFTQNMEAASAVTGTTVTMFYKNGVYYTRGNQSQTTGTGPVINSSALMYLNGTTDYAEIYIYCTASLTIDNSTYGCRFTGAMVRSA